jgi:hypothetical protein
MKAGRVITIMGVCLGFLLGLGAPAFSDVSPGDVIDKTNWQKVEGLVPESVLNWVKKGDFILDVGQLNFNAGDYWPETALRSLETNKGKYRLNEEGLIVDAQTGKTPEHVEGIPFPDVDQNDPRAAYMLMYNRMCYSYVIGNTVFPMRGIWVGRGGYEREIQGTFFTYPRVGFPGRMKEDNKDVVEKYSIVQVLAPYDIAGTNVLTWRYLDNKQDMTYTFVPAIRRVRRMSPANRSDAFLGTDMCVDDGYGYDGKIAAVEWAPVKKVTALVAWLDKDVQALEQNQKGEWCSTKDIKDIVFGYEKKDWTGAPWAPTNLVWVKRDVLILEFKPKDPYYNYGPQSLWVDAQVPYIIYYKVISDRAGVYWKSIVLALTPLESKDKKMRFLQGGFYVTIDDRNDHATILSGTTSKSISTWFADEDPNMFSLGGFQKLCK